MVWQVGYREPYTFMTGDVYQTFFGEVYDVGHAEYEDPQTGTPMEFMATVDLGPMAVRRQAFLSLGAFHEGFSAPGEPGPGLGIELTARAWLAGCVSLGGAPVTSAGPSRSRWCHLLLYTCRV